MNIDNYQLPLHNPWWEENFIILNDIKLKELQKQKYKYLHPLLWEFPQKKDAFFTVRGPRQIGKTTLLKQIIQKLIAEKIQPQNILYFPCDSLKEFNELTRLLQEYIEAKRVETKNKLYLFLDEISYVPQWQRAIKFLADTGFLKNTVCVITGSNCLDLIKSSERLPGRTGELFDSDRLFLPLNFKEYYQLVNPNWDAKFHYQEIPKLKKYFKDYLLTGGFPSTINEFYEKNYLSPKTYETYTRWIEGDLEHEGKSLKNAYALFKEIHQKLASRLSFTEIAKNTGIVSQKTVQEYLEIFERLFIIFRCDYFSLEQRKIDIKKNKKIYFSDPFIHNALIAKENGFLEDAFNYSKNVLLSNPYLDFRFEETIGINLYQRYTKFFYANYGKNNLEIDFAGFTKGKYDLFEVKRGDLTTAGYEKMMAVITQYKKLQIISSGQKITKPKVNVIPYYEFLVKL